MASSQMLSLHSPRDELARTQSIAVSPAFDKSNLDLPLEKAGAPNEMMPEKLESSDRSQGRSNVKNLFKPVRLQRQEPQLKK